MKQTILTDIRSAALTEGDALDIINCLVCQFSPSSLVGDILLGCAEQLNDAVIENDDEPDLRDFKRTDEWTEARAA